MLSTQLREDLNRIAENALIALDTDPHARKLMTGTMSPDEYDHYLAQVAHQIRGTSAMLAAASTRLVELGRTRLGKLFHEKSRQEDHDAWPSLDRRAIAAPDAEVTARDAAPAVLAYRSATWFMATTEPTSLLGVAHLLEVVGRERAALVADNLVKHSGIPRIERALRFLRGHGDADPHHVAAIEEALAEIEDPAEAERIVLAARMTAWLYVGFFQPARAAARQ